MEKRSYLMELTNGEVATLLCALMDYERGLKDLEEDNGFYQDWKAQQRNRVEEIKRQLR